MRWSWVVRLAIAVALAVPACGREPAPSVTVDTLLRALLDREDLPPGWHRNEPYATTDFPPGQRAQITASLSPGFQFALCQLVRPPGTPLVTLGPEVRGYARVVFQAADQQVAPVIDETILVFDDAEDFFDLLREIVDLCVEQQLDLNASFHVLGLPELGDDSFAFVARPKPDAPAYEPGWPDQHQVLIREGNALIGLVHRGEPATDVATTEALARRALEKLEEAIEKR